MFITVHESNAVKRAQAKFEKLVRETATQSQQMQLGHQGGGMDVDVNFIRPLNFWIGFADARNRHWNALGTGNPFREGHSIVAEINPPKEGINRRISGAFIKDTEGRIYLAHRGRVGGGRKGIGKKAFMSWYEGSIDWVRDGDRDNEMIVIGAIDDSKFMEKLGAFTKIVSIFKEQAVLGKFRA